MQHIRRREMKTLLMTTAAAVLICTPALAGDWWMRGPQPGASTEYGLQQCRPSRDGGFSSPAEAYEYLGATSQSDNYPRLKEKDGGEIFVYESKTNKGWFFYHTKEECEKKVAEVNATVAAYQSSMSKYR
jgi:hypothetical protein